MNEVLDQVVSGQVHRTCLTDDEIMRYVTGKMSRSEQFNVERHLVECDLCRDAVEGAGRLPQADLERHASSLSRRFHDRLQTKRRFHLAGWTYGLAAAAVILVIWGISFSEPPDKYEQIFRSEFKPYSSVLPLVRGESPSSLLRSALSHYEMESYDAAIHEFETVLAREPANELAHFYLGNALLAKGLTANAAEHLRLARTTGNDKIEEASQWYLALAHVRQGNETEAITILQTLSAAAGAFAARADGLLKRLAE